MAMSKCKECGKAVSTLAKTCPNCGVPKPALKKKSKSKTALKKKSKAKTERDSSSRELNYNPKTGSFDKVSSKKIKDSNYDPNTGYNPETGSFERELKKTKTSKTKNIYLKKEEELRRNEEEQLRREQRREEELRRNEEEQLRRKQRREEELRRNEEEQVRKQEEERRREEEQARKRQRRREEEQLRREQVDNPSVSNSSTNTGKKDIFDQFGNGTLDLATAFWGFFVFGSTILGVICGVLSEMVSAFFNVPYVIFTALIIVNTGQCAENYKQIMIKKNQSIVWGVLTQILCVISFLGLILFVYDLFKN